MLIHGPRLAQLEHRAEHIGSEVADTFNSIALTVSDWYRSFNDINITRTLWLERVNTTFLPLVARAYEESATDTWEKLNTIGDEAQRTLTAAIIPQIVSNLTESFLEGAKRRLVAIGDTLWNAMRLQLLQGLQLGEGLNQLRARLVAAAHDAVPQARNAAQTEVIGASNAGSYQQVKAAQVVALKTWVARDDDRTRPSHREVDGTRVDMNTKFIVGGYALDYPHDPTAPPEEVYGCRCTLVWNVVREGELTDELVIQSLAATAVTDEFHLPGKHEQKKHGNRKNKTQPTTSDRAQVISPMPEQIAMIDRATRSEARVIVRDHYDNAVVTGEDAYTDDEQKAVTAYSGRWYKPVNAALRADTTEGLDTEYRSGRDLSDLITQLDGAISKSRTAQDVVAFRGVDENIMRDLRVGDIIYDNAFISTSMSPVTAGVFSETVMQISIPRGTPALRPDKAEMELTLGRGTGFKVVSLDGQFPEMVIV